MEFPRLVECLEADYRRMREIAADADMSLAVSSCPGWTLQDLIEHTARVYLHKVLSTELGHEPTDWPPDLSGQSPIESFGDAHSQLINMFRTHEPSDHSGTWYEHDQTVGFWIRRMAQETVIHRRDAELAVDQPTPAAADLALDGIAELLDIFVSWGTCKWPEECAPQLKAGSGETWLVEAGPSRWWAEVTAAGVKVTEPVADREASVSVRGEPSDVLFWLWNRSARSDGPVEVTGEQAAISHARELLTLSTQ